MRSFCIAKASLIFSTKNITVSGYKVTKHLMSWPLNEHVKLTMLWTTGPRTTGEYRLYHTNVLRDSPFKQKQNFLQQIDGNNVLLRPVFCKAFSKTVLPCNIMISHFISLFSKSFTVKKEQLLWLLVCFHWRLSPFKTGSLLNKNRPCFKRALSSMETNRKS